MLLGLQASNLYSADAAIEQANWDSSKVKDKFKRDLDAHIAAVRAAKLSELTTLYEVNWHETKQEKKSRTEA